MENVPIEKLESLMPLMFQRKGQRKMRYLKHIQEFNDGYLIHSATSAEMKKHKCGKQDLLPKDEIIAYVKQF